ncbi:MAG: DUF4395 domain-containing protein [Paracoccaceae bacterium]
MKNLFSFGETVEGYNVNVINEREARAGAGILFLFAILSFLYAYTYMDFRFTKVFITFFMVDFFIRVLINPKFAPSLIAGRIAIAHQKPEYVGAPPKRFAWSIGLLLAVVMFVIVVVLELMTSVKIGICLLCLVLLYCEAVFGICIGCKLYNLVMKNEAQYCPGGVCEVHEKEAIQTINPMQILIVLIAAILATYFVIKVI